MTEPVIMYVCRQCNYGQYTPSSFCPRCPAHLHETEVPHPENLAHEETAAHLATHQIEYHGENYQVSILEQKKIEWSRRRQYLKGHMQDAQTAAENEDYELANRIKKNCVVYWQEKIKETEQQIAELEKAKEEANHASKS